MRLLLARHRRLLGVCLALAGLGITIRAAAPPPPPTVPVLVAARDLPAGRTLTSEDLQATSWPVGQAPDGRLTAATGRRLASPIRTGEPVTDARVVGPGLLVGQAPGTVAVPVRLGDPATGALVQAGDRVDVLASSSSSWSSSSWSASSSSQSSEPDLADGTEPEGSSLTGSRSTSSVTAEGGAERVAAGALVLAVPGASAGSGSGSVDDGSGSAGAGLSGLAGGALPGVTSGETSAAGLLVLAVSSREAAQLTALQSGHYLGIAVLPQR